MEQFLQSIHRTPFLAINRMSLSLVALGLALIYLSTRILNFAHGDITTIGLSWHSLCSG